MSVKLELTVEGRSIVRELTKYRITLKGMRMAKVLTALAAEEMSPEKLIHTLDIAEDTLRPLLGVGTWSEMFERVPPPQSFYEV